jgi:hypothetical protein
MVSRFPHGARLLALLTLLVTLVVAGCGGAEGGATNATGPSPAVLAPAESVFYGELLVRPSGEVEEGVVAALRKVLRVDDPGAELRRRIDELLAEEPGGESYGENYEPWLGSAIGLFVTLPPAGEDEPDVGVVVAARDRDALVEEMDRQRDEGELRAAGSYAGVAYDVGDDGETFAVVDDFLVLGTMGAFRAAVDASRDGSLADESRYTGAIDDVADDALAFFYVDPKVLAELLRDRDDVGPEAKRLFASPALAQADPVTVSLTASADEIVLEGAADNALADLAGTGEEDDGEVTVGQLPGDAWLALATPPLGPLVSELLDSSFVRDEAGADAAGLDIIRDLLGEVGGAGLFVRGDGPLDLGAGLLLHMTDAAAAQRFMTRVESLLRAGLGAPTRAVELSGARGFELQIPQSPQPIVVLAKGDRIAAGYAASSALDLLDPQQRFDESSAGKAALATLGDGFTPSFVLIAEPLVGLLRALDQLQVADLSDVLPYLGAYESIAVGAKRDDDETTVRVVVALR